jgi:hypothetical protein
MTDMSDITEDEEVKEVYARYGLALYYAQVLEHGLVNALVVLDLIPTERHLSKSAEQWGSSVDAFMDRHFEMTMGRLFARLRAVAKVPPDLENLLSDALRRRNWLAHDYFRERAAEFMSTHGRVQMLGEVDECRGHFEQVAERLEQVLQPLRKKAGITDQIIEQEYRLMLTAAKDAQLRAING